LESSITKLKKEADEMTVDPDVQLAAAGDIAAFERIYRRHNQRVYLLCLRMVKDASQAEDLTQEVFIQLFRKIHTFRNDSLFSTWLHRLTVNQVLMHFRKPIVKTERTTDDGETPIRIANGTENPSRMALIDRIALNEAMAQLAPGYRMVLILHDVEGYEHVQIGRMLGCAVGTSKSQLHKARLKLRALLTGRQKTRQKPDTARARLTPQLELAVHELA
jgi:RNA polymerase sigma-70 factor (ECF subfamily)